MVLTSFQTMNFYGCSCRAKSQLQVVFFPTKQLTSVTQPIVDKKLKSQILNRNELEAACKCCSYYGTSGMNPKKAIIWLNIRLHIKYYCRVVWLFTVCKGWTCSTIIEQNIRASWLLPFKPISKAELDIGDCMLYVGNCEPRAREIENQNKCSRITWGNRKKSTHNKIVVLKSRSLNGSARQFVPIHFPFLLTDYLKLHFSSGTVNKKLFSFRSNLYANWGWVEYVLIQESIVLCRWRIRFTIKIFIIVFDRCSALEWT